ncbi:MAG: PQQ-binding-like beta-propeller repeat protein [Bryobacteraceae bacterium]
MKSVVAGGNVYAYGYAASDWRTKKSAINTMYALDAKTGTVRWKWERRDKLDVMWGEGLAADSEAAYLLMVERQESLSSKNVLMAFDAATWKEKRRRKTSMYAPLASAPLLLDPQVLVIPDYPPGKEGIADEVEYVYRALDRKTGEKAWESKTAWKYGITATSGSVLFASDKKVHEVLNENNNTSPDSWISAVDLRSGKELWRSKEVELGIFTAPAAGKGRCRGIWAWTISL